MERPLVFCLNAAKNQADARIFSDTLLSEGVRPDALPKVITNEVGFAERASLYGSGGVYIVTSRILVIDFLNEAVDVSRVAGLLVYDAHEVVESSTEAFILRIFRQANQTGFIKAFSDEPEALVRGFNRLETTMKYLHLSRLYLWPRFHAAVVEALGAKDRKRKQEAEHREDGRETKRHKHSVVEDRRNNPVPVVVELDCSLTEFQSQIQLAIVAAMDMCLQDLKKSAPMLDASTLTIEENIFKAFHVHVRKQLESEWHRLPLRTKQVVEDLRTLRELLDYVLKYDCCTFYQLLLNLQSINVFQVSKGNTPSPWLSTVASDAIFQFAKHRVYDIVNKEAGKRETYTVDDGVENHEEDPGNNPGKSLDSNQASIEEWLDDPRKSEGQKKAEASIRNRSREGRKKRADVIRTRRLTTRLEQNPKWQILSEVLTEVHRNMANEKRSELFLGGIRALVLVKENGTVDLLHEYLSQGGQKMMKRKFMRFMRQVRTQNVVEGKFSNFLRNGILQVNGRARRLFHSSSSSDSNAKRSGKGARKKDWRKRAPDKEDPGLVAKKTDPGLLWASLTPEQILLFAEEGKWQDKLFDDIPSVDGLSDAPDWQRTSSNFSRPAWSNPGGSDLIAGGSGQVGSIDPASRLQNEPVNVIAMAEEQIRQGEDGATKASSVLLEEAPEAGRRGYEKRDALRFVDDHCAAIVTIDELVQGGGEEFLFLLNPDAVILYDVEPAVVRMLEVYQARRCEIADKQSRNLGICLKVYLITYEDSAEEQRYLSALKREKEAFEQLISQKASLVVPVQSILDPRVVRQSTSTRVGGRARGLERRGHNRVIVDIREFRSSLPSLLHRAELELKAVTLTVGDFVLSPEICVERKSLHDLFGSFLSGRLYKQAEMMQRYYACPTLLIEFSSERTFAMQNAEQITHHISPDNICSKIALLVISFPSLRILWSRSPHATVQIFEAVKNNLPQPDAEVAARHGQESAEVVLRGNIDGEETVGTEKAADSVDDARRAALDVLLQLPGITPQNYRSLARKARTLRALARLPFEEMEVCIGPVNAKKLAFFVRQLAPV